MLKEYKHGLDHIQVNYSWKWIVRKTFGLLACQLLAEPAQILSYNSLSAAIKIHLYMIRPLYVYKANILLFGFSIEKFPSWVPSQNEIFCCAFQHSSDFSSMPNCKYDIFIDVLMYFSPVSMSQNYLPQC